MTHPFATVIRKRPNAPNDFYGLTPSKDECALPMFRL
jgi:hypothetical protein